MSAAEQREAFQAALSDALDEAYQVEIAQTVYERLNERIHAHKENKDPEAPIITPGEIGGILRECGVAEEQVAAFQERCAQQFGSGAALNPANLIDAGRFEVKTSEATISVPFISRFCSSTVTSSPASFSGSRSLMRTQAAAAKVTLPAMSTSLSP